MSLYKKIKIICIVSIFYGIQSIIGQTAFHNFGEIQIHNDGKIGFHTHLINDGTFNTNLGLAGFYGDTQLNVSGNSVAEFFDVEVDVIDGLNLQTSLGVYNQLDFINGRIFTPRNDLNVTLEFLRASYSGETNDDHIDGYATLFGDIDFTFPIGDAQKLRPLSISQPSSVTTFKSAYFFEDPNTPTTFGTTFDTTSFSPILSKVNDKEFWDLNGDQEVEVTLTWDGDSNISNLTDDITLLRVVGWNSITSMWESLGRYDVTGDLDAGTITSAPFIPDNYVVLTIASEPAGNEVVVNTGFSPNNDGSNDVFQITGVDLTQENTLKVYDRWGSLVYEKANYDNTWGGRSQHKYTVDKKHLLPVGTYFYFLSVKDSFTGKKKMFRGWVYINY